MSGAQLVANLVARQAVNTASAAVSTAAAAATAQPACTINNSYDGRIGLRISAIFVILVGSLFGEDTIEPYSITL